MPTRSSSVTHCVRPTSGDSCASSWRPTPTSTSVLSATQIASCFDESRLLVHAKTLIDRLEQLEDHARVSH